MKYKAAEGLSRISTDGKNITPLEDTVPCLTYSTKEGGEPGEDSVECNKTCRTYAGIAEAIVLPE